MNQPRSDLPQPMLVDMAAAVRAYQAQNFEQVIGLLAPWAEREPGRPEPLQMLGVALARRGRLDEALQHQARATELAPQDVAAWVNLASVGVTKRLARKPPATPKVPCAVWTAPPRWTTGNPPCTSTAATC